jgi:hypothetical protein
VDRIDGFDGFDLDNHGADNEEIEAVSAVELDTFVGHGERLLEFKWNAAKR